MRCPHADPTTFRRLARYIQRGILHMSIFGVKWWISEGVIALNYVQVESLR